MVESEYTRLVAEYEAAVHVFTNAVDSLTCAMNRPEFDRVKAAVDDAHAKCAKVRARLEMARKFAP
jgi:hypothetical protein